MPRRRNARSSSFELDSSSAGQQVRQRLDDRHVGAEGLPDAGELHADHAAAEHDDRRRHRRRASARARCVMIRVAVDLQAGQRPRVRAGREDDRLGGGVRRAVDLDGRRRRQPAGALDDRDLAALHQPGQALVAAGRRRASL